MHCREFLKKAGFEYLGYKDSEWLKDKKKKVKAQQKKFKTAAYINRGIRPNKMQQTSQLPKEYEGRPPLTLIK